MATHEISCTVGTTDPTSGLGLEVWLDQDLLYNYENVDFESKLLKFDVSDAEANRELRFVMKNKTQKHTQISETGEILQDARLTINNVSFDSIELTHAFIEQTTYTHDFNGTSELIVDKFYGEMGCNGFVSLKFETPIYLWLLEHL